MIRRVFVVGVAAAVAGAMTLLLRDESDERASSPVDLPQLLDLRARSVRQLTVTWGTRRAQFDHLSSGSWVPRDGTPAETIPLLEGFEDRIFPLKAYRRITADSRSSEYGLADPQIRVEVRSESGVTRMVLLGSPTFTGGGFYAARANTPGVFLIARRVMDDFRSLAKGERVDSPRSPAELERLQRAETRAKTEPEVISPWLRQSLDAGAVIPEEVRGG